MRRIRGGSEEEEESSQGTGINDSWIWTTGWGLTVGVGGGGCVGQGRATGEDWDKHNRTTISNMIIKINKMGLIKDLFDQILMRIK